MRYRLHTDICIYIERDRPSAVRARFARAQVGVAGMSAITLGELSFGAARGQQREEAAATLRALVRVVPVPDLPSAAAGRYGRRRARPNLVTNNERGVRRVDGLRVENWAAEP